MSGGLALALLPGVAAAQGDVAVGLPDCGEAAVAQLDDGEVATPWQVELDGEGVVRGHRMKLRRRGVDTTIRTGPRGFSVRAGPGRVLVGERANADTALAMIDTRRACRLWSRVLDRLVYTPEASPDGKTITMASHEPLSRLFEGRLEVDVETGASGGLIDGECITECQPNDGDVAPGALEPAGVARPVPYFAAGGWGRDTTLRFRWRSGAVPPDWAKSPLLSAADDALRTSKSRSPRFAYRSDAGDSVRYTGSFPTYCRTGIACAARSMPTFWAVWLRPHGTDFSWGTLRWCQKNDAHGCFDIRRVMLHELGHVTGLNHPSSNGAPLAAQETVMHAITPARPSAGSSRHAFGRCDVATLQELYGMSSYDTLISTCNDVATTLGLVASKASISAGDTVRLKAFLNVSGSSAYGYLAGDPLVGRSVKLKYRRAGSTSAWTTVWMSAHSTPGRYDVQLKPSSTWEFKAVFTAPDDEGLRYSRSSVVEVKVRK